MFQGSFKSISRKFQGNFKGVSRNFQGCSSKIEVVLRGFEGYLKEVTLVCQGSFNGV